MSACGVTKWCWSGLLAFSMVGPLMAQESGAMKIQEQLAKRITVDFAGQSFPAVIEFVKQKSKVPFVLDTYVRHRFPNFQNIGGPGGFGGGQNYLIEINDEPVSVGIKRFLEKFNLTYVVMQNQVLITNPRMALAKQIQQKVSLSYKNQPLDTVLKQLSQDMGLQIIIDPEVGEINKNVTLDVKETSLENGIRLLAFMGGLKSVRVENVIVVTTAERAKLLPAESRLPGDSGGMYPPDVDEGIAMPGFPGGVEPGVAPGGFGGGADGDAGVPVQGGVAPPPPATEDVPDRPAQDPAVPPRRGVPVPVPVPDINPDR